LINAEKSEERLVQHQREIEKHLQAMQTQAERNLNELEDIYQWAREVLAERLIVLKRQVSDNLSREEKDS